MQRERERVGQMSYGKGQASRRWKISMLLCQVPHSKKKTTAHLSGPVEDAALVPMLGSALSFLKYHMV